MPTITKLSPEDVQVLQTKQKSQREQIADQYDALLAPFEAGDWGDVVLDDNDVRVTVRSRLQRAAEQRGLGLAFKRAVSDRLRFQVVARDDVAARSGEELPVAEDAVELPPAAPAPTEDAAPTESAQPAPKRRGGRPKAAVQASEPIPTPTEAPQARGHGRKRQTVSS